MLSSVYNIARKCVVIILVVSPLLFYLIHAFGLFYDNCDSSWNFHFVYSEYKYIIATYPTLLSTSSLLHDYDITIYLLSSIVIVYIIATIILVIMTRYSNNDIVYDSEIMRNIRKRSEKKHMRPVYIFLRNFGIVVIIIVCAAIFIKPDAEGVLFRSWAEHSLVTFLAAQVLIFAFALLVASEWLIMTTIVLVSLTRRRQTAH